jgi:hypothetical protein
MALGNDSVTVYSITSFGLGIGEAEGKLIDHGVKSPRTRRGSDRNEEGVRPGK